MAKSKKPTSGIDYEKMDPYAGDVTSGPGGSTMPEDIPPPAPPAPPVRRPASSTPVTKKAVGGKIGRGCGVAMRGGGCVMRKGGMC